MTTDKKFLHWNTRFRGVRATLWRFHCQANIALEFR